MQIVCREVVEDSTQGDEGSGCAHGLRLRTFGWPWLDWACEGESNRRCRPRCFTRSSLQPRPHSLTPQSSTSVLEGSAGLVNAISGLSESFDERAGTQPTDIRLPRTCGFQTRLKATIPPAGIGLSPRPVRCMVDLQILRPSESLWRVAGM